MNAQQVKEIPITDYLSKRGLFPVKENSSKAFYPSLANPSKGFYLCVDKSKNIWFDYNDRGTIIDLCLKMDRAANPKEAMRILSDLKPEKYNMPTFPDKQQSMNPEVKILEIRPITSIALLQYVKSRKIDASLAGIYLMEARFRMKGKDYFALCFKNDQGGYELRNKFWKGSTRPKFFSSIRGRHNSSVNVFEGFFDFLSALSYYKTDIPGNDTVVLNSLAFLDKAISALGSYHKLNLYLDNDESGKKAASKLREKLPVAINRSEILFPGWKDFNEFVCGS